MDRSGFLCTETADIFVSKAGEATSGRSRNRSEKPSSSGKMWPCQSPFLAILMTSAVNYSSKTLFNNEINRNHKERSSKINKKDYHLQWNDLLLKKFIRHRFWRCLVFETGAWRLILYYSANSSENKQYFIHCSLYTKSGIQAQEKSFKTRNYGACLCLSLWRI